jgi:hypothetical protein
MPIVLHSHQEKVVKYLLDHKGIIVLHSTGAGKTFTSIASAEELLKRKIISHAIVLVNKSIINQYYREIDVIDQKIRKYFIVITVQKFINNYQTYKPLLNRSILIVDEAHHYTNLNATSTQYLIQASKLAKRVILLTGTLYTNKLFDVVPLRSMVSGENPITKKNFEEGLAIHKGTFLKEYLKGYVSVFLIDKNKNSNYPKVIVHDVNLKMNPKTEKLISKEKNAPFFMGERKHILGLSGQQTFDNNTELSKICEKCLWLLNHLPQWIERGEKTILYVSFLDAGVRVIQKMIMNMGINCVVIDGEVTQNQRAKIMESFNQPLNPQKLLKSDSGDNGTGTDDSIDNDDDSIDTDDDDDTDDDSTDDDDDTDDDSTDADKKSIKSRRKNITIHNVCGNNNSWFLREAKEKKTIGKNKKPIFHYSYKSPTGQTIIPSKQQLLATQTPPIPPRWTPSVVCKNNDKLLWVAQDLKGRYQRRYSKKYVMLREKKKLERLLKMDYRYWEKMFHQVKYDLEETDWTLNKLHAMALLLMYYSKFRPGGGKSDKTGVVTLQKKSAKILKNKSIQFEFIGKSGVLNKYNLSINEFNFTQQFRNLLSLAPKPNSLIFQNMTLNSFREYCRGLNIRPKDFRTYYANSTLIEQLCQYNDPIILAKKSKRNKIINNAIKSISQGLNNRPATAKSSYIFSALWMCYAAYPMTFLKLSQGAKSQSLPDVMVHMLKNLDWEKIVYDYEQDKSVLFSGDVPILIISDAGSESLDLKGVRHVVFLDSVWTEASENQIIGRAQRHNSHIDLPKSQRNVNVWRLKLIGGKHNADTHMAEIVDKKREESKKLYKFLKDISI